MNNKRGILFALLTALMLAVMVPSIMPGKNNAASVEAKKARISKSRITLRKGGTFKLFVRHKKKKIRWHTSNAKIATVSRGKVTAKGIGKCTVWARHGKRRLTCAVTVREDYFTVSNSSLKLNKNESQTIVINSEKKSAITVSTSNKYIATASPLTGPGSKIPVRITGEGTAGSAVITIKEKKSGRKRVVNVTVAGNNEFRLENASDANLELTEGETRIVMVRCDQRIAPKCSSKGDISCNWGSSWNERLIPLKITGEYAGENGGSGSVTLTLEDSDGNTIDEVGISVSIKAASFESDDQGEE